MKQMKLPASIASAAFVTGCRAPTSDSKPAIASVWAEFPKTVHEWQTWRRCLYDFAPKLFK